MFKNFFKYEIVIYGAGITGVEVHKVLVNYFENVNVSCFCDTYKRGFMNTLPIISPEELKNLYLSKSLIIIVAGLSNYKEIEKKLKQLDIALDCVCSIERFNNIIVENINDLRISEWYRRMKQYKSKLSHSKKCNLYLDWWCPEHYCENDILVYQPGKVGSSTICNSLSVVGVNVTHFHYITDYFIYDLIPELAWEPNESEKKIINECSEYCCNRLKQANRLKIITLVREPLIRDFSLFLYHMNRIYKKKYLSVDNSLIKACEQGIKKRATQNGKCKYGYQFEWFNKELKNVFGIDIYNYPFDKKKGFTIITQNNIEVLIIKLERLNDLANEIKKFTGAPDNFKLISVNQSKDKNYRDLYKYLKKLIKVPNEILSMYYNNNPLVNHFYSEKEKEIFLKSWANNINN